MCEDVGMPGVGVGTKVQRSGDDTNPRKITVVLLCFSVFSFQGTMCAVLKKVFWIYFIIRTSTRDLSSLYFFLIKVKKNTSPTLKRRTLTILNSTRLFLI